jgi:DNA-binding GntR family transcriptional regulator
MAIAKPVGLWAERVYGFGMASLRRSHRDRIHDLYLGRIRRGEIGRDDRLVDTAIAAELGVSRMPVREALMRLSHEGYLTATTRGFMLPSPGVDRVLEVFDLRLLLEPRAAALAAGALTAETLAQMREAVEDAAGTPDSRDIELFFQASEKFRNGWLSAVPNVALREAIDRYLWQVQAVRLATMREPGTHGTVVRGQRALLAAFAAGDALLAHDHMLRFVVAGEAAYRAHLAAEGGPAGAGPRQA